MERFNFGYSVKNIPIPGEEQYKLQLINKIELLIKRMRWKALFFDINQNKNDVVDQNNQQPETYGMKSPNCPPPIKELSNFEKDLFDLVNKIKFRKIQCEFQSRMRNDIRDIQSSNKTLTPADKTSNLYKLPKEKYKQILQNSITKTYKKTTTDTSDKINLEGKKIAEQENVLNRMNMNSKNECFITLKDHKPNFENKLPTRLINPAKNEIGRISKVIVQKTNTALRTALQLQQWNNTNDVINWFKNS